MAACRPFFPIPPMSLLGVAGRRSFWNKSVGQLRHAAPIRAAAESIGCHICKIRPNHQSWVEQQVCERGVDSVCLVERALPRKELEKSEQRV